MKKKIIALFLCMAMVVATLAACGSTSAESTGSDTASADSGETGGETEPESVVDGDPDAEDVLLEIVHDGDATKITSSAYDEYFGGDAAAGVEALLDAGKIYVNGIKVPATEDETSDYQVNGVSSLYKTDIGWGYNVHKTTSADNLSFEDARLGFYETITTVRGHVTTLYGDSETGLVNKIDSQSFEVFRITYFEDHGGMVDKIERGDFELETNRIRPDVETVTVSDANFDENIQVGDIVIYYYGSDGWVMQKADSIEGTLSKDEDDNFVINAGESDEYVSIESNVSRYNLISSNRPTQFYDSYVNLGLTDVPVVTWCTPTGHPICFTYGDKAASKDALALAIENATAAKDGVAVSTDGSDVPAGTMWVTQEDLDAFEEAISEAESVCNNNSTAIQEYDMAIYNLATALGEAGESPTGFLGAQGEGSMG